MSGRCVLLVSHTGRADAVTSAREVARKLDAAGVGVRTLASEAPELDLAGAGVRGDVVVNDLAAANGTEVVLVLGGDGTLLRAAELARPAGVPLLGINLGHVGFLAEAEREDLAHTVQRVLDRDYQVEERLTLDVTVWSDDVETSEWALNEVSVEKAARERMLEVIVEVDGRPLSRWGCDGVICATPTGSTAYAWSAGGPVVWPSVEALLMVPISAHALFARPLVTTPSSVLAVELVSEASGGVLWADGRRTLALEQGARIEVRRSTNPVRFARLSPKPFTDRLVAKFALPVGGWRGHPS
ncbi:MAG: NAD kinase [Actinomycetes bacterium]